VRVCACARARVCVCINKNALYLYKSYILLDIHEVMIKQDAFDERNECECITLLAKYMKINLDAHFMEKHTYTSFLV